MIKKLHLKRTAYDANNDRCFQTAESAIETVISPALVAFSAWVIKEAGKDKIKSLYFLSRDAYPVFVVANHMCKIANLDIECRYLYCSRFSLRIPMYSEDMDEAIEYITRSGIDINLDKLIKRTGLHKEDIPESVWQEILRINDGEENLNRKQLAHIRNLLKNSKELKTAIRKASDKAWPTLREYFIQEGMLENNIAVVDSGWTGTTQKSINKIRQRCGNNNDLIGYYFGLYDVPDGMDENKYRHFYFGPSDHMSNKLFFSNCLIETVFSRKDQGTTCGYKKTECGIEPVFEINHADEYDRYIAEKVMEEAINIISETDAESYESIIQFKSGLPSKNKISRLMWSPSYSEAESFGRLGFSDDLLDDSIKQLAPVMDEPALYQNHLLWRFLTRVGIITKPLRESGWYEGSAVRSSKYAKFHRYGYLAYKLLSINMQAVKFRLRNRKQRS